MNFETEMFDVPPVVIGYRVTGVTGVSVNFIILRPDGDFFLTFSRKAKKAMTQKILNSQRIKSYFYIGNIDQLVKKFRKFENHYPVNITIIL